MSDAHIIDDRPFGGFHRKVTFLSAGGPFLDGYIVASIGAAIADVASDLKLGDAALGLVAATAMVGIFFGGLIGGRISDAIGRQSLYTLDLIAMVVASVLCAFVQEGWQLILVRLLAGVAVGVDYPIATSMLAEWLPARRRGRMMGILVTAFGAGMIAAYVVALSVSAAGVPGGWRWVLASAAVPALIILLARMGTPESPRWLVARNRVEEARESIRRAFGESPTDSELRTLENSEPATRTRLMGLFRPPYLGRTAFVGAFWLCQVAPTFAIEAFYPVILGGYGFTNGTTALLWALVLISIGVGGAVPALFWVDRYGRRPLVIWSFAGTVLTLVVLGIFPGMPAAPVLMLLAANAFAAACGSILQMVYPAELFPTAIRASAMGVATAISRVGSALGTFLIPLSLSGLGMGPTMLISGAVALIGLLVCIVWAPETRERPLHEVATAATKVVASQEELIDDSFNTASDV
ncbi:MFS transporter [Streptomyces olivaceoviridis]|uniref:MFS transporter n=1 Tax=Streptomyces olivaceoviridis TaxID=1921 RepID=UPI0033B801DC